MPNVITLPYSRKRNIPSTAVNLQPLVEPHYLNEEVSSGEIGVFFCPNFNARHKRKKGAASAVSLTFLMVIKHAQNTRAAVCLLRWWGRRRVIKARQGGCETELSQSV